jgi:hypothetical protein
VSLVEVSPPEVVPPSSYGGDGNYSSIKDCVRLRSSLCSFEESRIPTVNPHPLIMVLVSMCESFFIDFGSQFCNPIPSIHAIVAFLLTKELFFPVVWISLAVWILCCVKLGIVNDWDKIQDIIIVFLSSDISLLGCSQYIEF